MRESRDAVAGNKWSACKECPKANKSDFDNQVTMNRPMNSG